MITYLLIKKLVAEPSPEASPIGVAVNNPTSLLTQTPTGDGLTVKVFGTRPAEQTQYDTPFVRLYDTGKSKLMSTSLGGNKAVVMSSTHYMRVEGCANGASEWEAQERATKLVLAATAVIEAFKLSPNATSSQLMLSDDGGSQSNLKITGWQFAGDVSNVTRPVSGAGNDDNNSAALWTCTRVLEYMVFIDTTIRVPVV